MKLKILWVLLLCGLLGASGQAQSISVHIGSDSLCGPGTVEIPVTVTGFSNVAGFTLITQFDSTVLQYQDIVGIHPSLLLGSGVADTLFYNLFPDSATLSVTWLNFASQSLNNGDTLFVIQFNYLGGTSSLSVFSPASGFFSISGLPVAVSYHPGQVHQASPPAILTHPWDESICLGFEAFMEAYGSGATAYQWEYLPPGGSWGSIPPTSGQGLQSPWAMFFPDSAGVYAIRCIVSDYCADTTDVVYLTVNPPPQIQVQIDTTILAGQPAYLSANGGDYYLWSTGSQQPQDTVSPLQSTTYSVTVADTNYCEATDSGLVVVTSLPAVSLSLGQVSGCGDTIYVPVIGQGLDSVGAISIHIFFDPAQMSLPLTQVTPALPSFVYQSNLNPGILQGSVSGNLINIQWSHFPGPVSIQSDTLLWLTFISNSGYSTLEWDSLNTAVGPGLMAQNPLILSNGSIEIFSNPPPPVASGDSICSGEAPSLNAAGTGTLNWYNLPLSSLLHQGANYAPALTTPGLYAYYVRQIDSNGCESAGDTAQLRIYPVPLVDAGLPDTIPFGQFVNLNGSASGGSLPYQFSWSPDSLALNPAAATTPTLPLTQTTSFALEVEDANSCQGIDSVLIVITGGALTIDVLSASPAAACPGDSIQMHLQVSGGNPPFSYFWMPDFLFSDPFIANPRMASDSSVRVYIEISDGFNWVMDSIDIVIHPLPEDVAFEGDSQYCPGTAGAPLWLDNSGDSILYELYRDGNLEAGLMGLNDTLHFGMFYDTGVYTVLAIDTATGCQRWLSDSVVLEILEAPVAEMLPDTNMAICLGDALLLTATQTGGNTFQWVRQPGISSIPTTLSVLNDIPSPPGMYYYTLIVTNADGCSDTSQTVEVQVNALPIASIWAPAELCEDASVLISSAGSAGSGTLSTQWLGTATGYMGNLFTQTPAFQGAPAGTYSLELIVWDSIGCTDTAAVSIQVNPSPQLNAGPDTTVAYGSAVQLYADSGQNINLNYSWAPATLLNNAGIPNPQTLPLTTTTWFNVYTYDTNTICAASDSLLVTVLGSAVRIDSLFVSAPAVCPNDTITLQAFVSGGSGQYAYQWSAGAFPQGDSIVQIVAPSGAGTQFYALTVTDTITGEFDTINGYIQVYSLPVVQFPSQSECEGDSLILDAILQTPSQAPYTYSWSGPGNFSASGNPVSIPNAATMNAGTYQLLMEDGNGCRVQYQNNVIVRDTPNVTIFSADTLICPAQPAQLQALVTGVLATPTYIWNTTPPQTASNPVVYPQDTTLYTVTVTASNCSASASIQINTLPGVVSYIDTSFCEGDSVYLNNQWYSQPGFYFDSTVTQAGCDSIISITIQTWPLPVDVGETVLDTSLIACYPLDGNAQDGSGNALHGILNAPVGSTNRSGLANAALVFDGINDEIVVPHAPELDFGSQDFTLVAWIYPTDFPGNMGLNAILTKHTGDDGSWLFRVALDPSNSNSPRINFETNHPTLRYYGNTPIQLNTWQMVAVTRSGNNYTFYVNGLPDGSFSDTKSFYTNEPLRFSGQGNVTDERFSGAMDDVRIFGRALSSAEMASLYTSSCVCNCFPGDSLELILARDTLCENESTSLHILPSQPGILYFLSDTTIPSSFITSAYGNGDSLTFAIPGGIAATTFHILAVDTLSGCFRYLDTLIHIHRLPLPLISITGDSLICQGETTQLTASGGQSYLWNTIPPSSAASVNVSPSATNQYSVTVSLDACVDSAQSLVTVIPPVFTQSFDTICEGDSLEIAGQFYSQSGTYNDTLVASSGCDSIVSVHLTIYPAPWAILPAIPSVSNCTDSLVDPRDGRIYETTLIGNQCWMAENLNYGTMINSSNQMGNNGVAEKYCYANQLSSCNSFGGLYQWEELMQYASTAGIQGVCPPGWHIPSDNEWKVLEGRVDGVFGVGNAEWDNVAWRGYDAGYQLKDSLLWANFGGGINGYGFTARPGGNLNPTGSFVGLIELGSFWTSSTDPVTSQPFRRLLNWSQNRVFRSPENPGAALSVRCVKDTLINPPGAIQIWHSDSICETEEAYIHILSSQPGVEYFLYDTNTPPAFTDVGMGNGDTLTFVIPPFTAPGAYEIFAMDMAFGCERLLDTLIEIVVTPLPQVSLTQDTAICYGSSITLVAGGGQHYAWNTMPPAFGNSLTMYPTILYQYTVTVTTNGCSDSASVWVDVLPLSYDTVYAEICEGDTFFFENYPYTQAGIFTDTLISSNGCDSILSLNLSVHPLPYGLGAAVAVVPGCASPMVDPRDGKSYDIVQIGTQCWMGENLDYGAMIPLSSTQSNNALAEKYCYDNIPANCDLYGGLYTWDEMMSYASSAMNQGLCPPGWRIPTDNDWKALEGASDNGFGPGNAVWDNTGYRGTDAGYRWKSLTGWNNNGQGNNALGLNVYASGQALPLSAYQNQGAYAHFWSSSSGSGATSGQAWKRELNWNQSGVGRLFNDKGRALSVRCLKDSLFSSVPVLTLQHGDSLCSYDSLYISLENSQDGIQYTLIETQSQQSFSSPQAGNGGTLVFAVPPAFTGGYFEIIAEDTLHFCTRVLDSLIHITVLPDPQVSISPGDTTLCAGESITLIAAGGGTYQWTNGPQTAQNTVSPPMTTQYAVFVSLDGCSAMDSVTISVTQLPIPVLHPDTAICAGDSIQLWASGGSQYFWSPGAGLSQQDIPDPWASPVTTTMYYLTVTEQNCGAEDSMLIEVHPLPIVMAGPDTSICAGESLELYASGGSTYEWNTVPPQFGDTILLQASSSYLYEVNVTDSNGCSNLATVQVSVNPVPLVDAGIDVTVSYGSDTVLYGSASGSAGPYSYAWNPSALLNNPGLAQPSTLPMTANTTFYLSVTDVLSGCGGIDSMTVFITGGPMQVDSFSANPDGVCPGDSSSLVVYVSGGTGQYFYQWEILNGPVIGQDSLVQVSPANTTDYRCIVTDSLRWDTVYVSVEVFPNPVLVLSPDTSLCPADTITLTASGGSWYRWDSLPLSQASHILWQANAAGAVVVETIDSNGCTAVDSILITLLPLPQIQTIISNPVCEDNLIALLSDIVPGGGTVAPYQALWTGPSGFNAQIYDTVIPAAQLTMEGMYYFSLTDGNGCRVQDSGYVTVYPLPQLTMSVVPNGVCEKDNAFLITATPWPGGTFTGTGLQNNFNGSAWFRPWIAGAGGPYDLSYLFTDTNGCATDTTAYIIVHPQPDAEILGLQSSYCVNDPIDTLFGQPSVGGVFTGPGITNINPGVALFDPALAGSGSNLSIHYSYLDVTGCGDDTVYTVDVLPQPTVLTFGDTAICSGDTATISASGGTTYQWSPTAGLSLPGIANPQASPAITTTYYVTVTESGCSSVDSVNVVVLPLPPAFAGNDTFYCAGDSVSLTASGGISYLWSNGMGGASITVAPVIPTLYGVTVSDGICTASDTVQVSPIALPVADAGPDSSLCAGDSLQLQASGGSGYLWSPALSLSQSNIDNPFAFPTASTMYYVTVSDQGCSAADSVFVEVIPLPVITLSQDTTICAGDTAFLAGGGGGSYAWSPQAGLSAPNASQTLAFPTVTTLYTLTVEENGCSSSAGVNVQVQALPPANAGADTAFCVGDSVQLTGSGGLSYVWSTGATTPSIYVQPADTVYYYLSVSDGLCEASDSVRVHPKPNPVADAGQDTVVCLNDSVALHGQGGTSWLWAPAGGLSSTTVAQPMASPAASGFYYLTVSDNGCTGTDSVYVDVLPLPPADAGQDTSICAGASALLTASGGTSYTWSTIPVQTSAQINVSPANTTIYYVSVSDGQCSAVDSVTVNVDPLPQIVLTQDTAICEGDDAVLNVSGGGTYVWSTVPASTAAQVTVSPANTTTYYVSVSIGLCEAVDSVEVEVIPLPLAEAGPDTSFCAGDSIRLNASGGTQYLWSPASGLSAVNVFNPWASPAASQMYYVAVSALGCSASDSIYLTVIPLPLVDAGPDTSICPGIPLQLSGSGGTSYQWAPATFLDDPLIANPVATLNTAQTFYLTATENGCSASDSVRVDMHPLPLLAVDPSNPEICAGASIVLTATGGTNYQWSPASGLNTTAGAVVIASPLTSTLYTLSGENAFGCIDSIDVQLTVHPPPVILAALDDPVICRGETVEIQASGAEHWLWYPKSGLNSDTSGTVIASPSWTTVYTLVGFSAQGCSDTLEIEITVLDRIRLDLGPDRHYCSGEEILLEIPSDSSITYVEWQDGSSTPFYIVTEPGTYWVFVDNGVCPESDTLILYPCTDIWIPNAFTPNGDGLNEFFEVKASTDLYAYEIWIFNRWGELVYNATDIRLPWDGRHKGEEAPIGVYNYVIEYTGRADVAIQRSHRRTGKIVLIR